MFEDNELMVRRGKKAFIKVDNSDELYGRTDFIFTKKGNINYVYKVNKKILHRLFYIAILKLNRFKFYD